MLKSNINTVTTRQEKYGLSTIRLEYTQDNLNYWLGHLIEELLEFTLAAPEDKVVEAADVLIFLQNYSSVLLPATTLRISLSNAKKPKYIQLAKVLFELRKTHRQRKDWKNYKSDQVQIQFAFQQVLVYLSWFVPAQEIEKAYLAKEKYNTARNDWDRNK
jgi:hypothetical protein